MPVNSVGFSCKLNMVVCPIPSYTVIGTPCVSYSLTFTTSFGAFAEL